MFKKRKTAAENPFRRDMLPHNRRQLWKDTVKLQYLPLLIQGMVLFIFAIPLTLNLLIADIYIAGLTGDVQTVLAEAATVQLGAAAVSIALLAVLGVGLAGLLRICRQYAWGEVVTPTHDFVVGIKQNVKQTLGFMILAGLVYTSCVYADILLNTNPDSVMQYVSAAWTTVVLLFFLPIGAYMLVCIAVYNNTMWQNFIQGFVLYMKAPLKTLGSLFCCFGIGFLYIIPSTAFRFVLTIIFMVGMPFMLLGWFLCAYNRLDRFVNCDKHPHLVNKGLYQEGAYDDGEDEDL